MSLVALAIRTCAQRVLNNATFAENRVYDSAITALDDAMNADPKPMITIVTEDESHTVSGFDVNNGERTLNLTIEAAIGSLVDGETEGSVEFVIPNTDGGLEITCNLLTRQIMRALFIDGGEWGVVLRKLMGQIKSISTMRGAGAEKGLRFAARQITIECAPLSEPKFGVAIAESGIWADYLALIETQEDLAWLSPVFRQAAIGEAIPEWRQFGTAIGLSETTQAGVGLSPYIDPPIEPLTLITIENLDDNGQIIIAPTGG